MLGPTRKWKRLDVKRPEIKRHEEAKLQEEVKHSPEDKAFPFRLNQSEGDEKW